MDTLMSGWVGVNDLAAIGLGSSIMLPVFIMGTGVLLAITPLVGKALSSQHQNLPFFLFQGIWVAVPIGLVSLFLLINSQWLLHWLDLSQTLFSLTNDYLYFVAFGMPAIALYQAIRFYWEGLGHTLPTMWISFFALLLNLPLNAIFIYGFGPIEARGAAGCGIATSLVMWSMLLTAVVYVSKVKLANQKIDWLSIGLPKWHEGLERILAIGAPNAMALLFEVSLFTFIALFIAPLGASVIAGHQIAISFTSLLFMLPLSLGMAITVRVSQTLGQQDPSALLHVIRTAMLVAVLVGLGLALFTFMMREQIAWWYTDSEEVVWIAVSLIIFASIYQIFDAIQVLAAGCLRGFQDTQITMWVTLLSYWGVGLGIGYLLTYTDWLVPQMGVSGFWLGIVLGLFLASILLSWRLMIILKRHFTHD